MRGLCYIGDSVPSEYEMVDIADDENSVPDEKASLINSSHIGIASSLPTTAYVKMIDVFMIFTMTIPLLEIIGHTYAESLRLQISELDELSDLPRRSFAGSPIQPLGPDDSKLDLPHVKSKLFANDKRSGSYNGIIFGIRPGWCGITLHSLSSRKAVKKRGNL